jgi:hypothetical protein
MCCSKVILSAAKDLGLARRLPSRDASLALGMTFAEARMTKPETRINDEARKAEARSANDQGPMTNQ